MKKLHLSYINVISCKISEDNIINLVLLLTKMYIYRCKCNGTDPCIEEFEHCIKNYYRIEKYDASNKKNKLSVECKWRLVRFETGEDLPLDSQIDAEQLEV